jgi:hypothetical protein
MFDSISNVAETLATTVSESRRGFLADIGRAGLGAVGVLGLLLGAPGQAKAARHSCWYNCGPCLGLQRGGSPLSCAACPRFMRFHSWFCGSVNCPLDHCL